MRYRFIFGIWIAGALITGFALGEMIERDLYGHIKTPLIHRHSPRVTSDADQDGEGATNILTRC